MAVKSGNVGGCIALIAAFCLSLIRCSFATQYVVGDAAGWTLPSFGHVNYTAWASNHTFRVGDSLLFNYRPDIHNIMLVTRSDYRSCSSPNPVASFDDGKTTMSLTSAGSKYYMCGVAGHCGLGQKLAIMVLPAGSESPVSSPISGGPTASPLAPGISPSPSKAPASAPSSSGTSIGCVLFTLMIGVVGVFINSSLLL